MHTCSRMKPPSQKVVNVRIPVEAYAAHLAPIPEAVCPAKQEHVPTLGDIGYVDEDGYLFLCDRKDHMIIRGGVNIYPQAIENELIEHPKVADAAVIGVPHPELGEEVAAVVVLREGAQATERELQAFVATRAAEFKVPKKILFMDEIPKGATGKLQRIGLAAKLGLA